MDAPPDPVTAEQSARILACDERRLPRLLRPHGWADGLPTSRRQVEELALTRWKLAHSRSPNSYWVTRDQAAAILSVNRARVGQLVEAGLIPYERARTVRSQIVFRPDQLTVVARARRLRRPGASLGDRPAVTPTVPVAALRTLWSTPTRRDPCVADFGVVIDPLSRRFYKLA